MELKKYYSDLGLSCILIKISVVWQHSYTDSGLVLHVQWPLRIQPETHTCILLRITQPPLTPTLASCVLASISEVKILETFIQQELALGQTWAKVVFVYGLFSYKHYLCPSLAFSQLLLDKILY